MKRHIALVTPASAPALAARDASELAVMRLQLEGQEEAVERLRQKIAETERRHGLTGRTG